MRPSTLETAGGGSNCRAGGQRFLDGYRPGLYLWRTPEIDCSEENFSTAAAAKDAGNARLEATQKRNRPTIDWTVLRRCRNRRSSCNEQSNIADSKYTLICCLHRRTCSTSGFVSEDPSGFPAWRRSASASRSGAARFPVAGPISLRRSPARPLSM